MPKLQKMADLLKWAKMADLEKGPKMSFPGKGSKMGFSRKCPKMAKMPKMAYFGGYPKMVFFTVTAANFQGRLNLTCPNERTPGSLFYIFYVYLENTEKQSLM